MSPPHGLLCVCAGLLLFGNACATTSVSRHTAYDQQGIQAILRSYKEGGETVEKGFSHPAPIASVRLAHALSFIDVEVGEGKKRQRVPAVNPTIIYQVADALEVGLEQANENQEVVVMAVRKERRLGIFHAKYLTSLVANVKGDLLTVQVGHADWEIPKIDEYQRGGDDLPEPRADKPVMRLRVLPDTALTLLGPQTVALDWKSDRFRDPSRIQLSPSGEVRRREVLLEDQTLEAPVAPEATVPLDRLDPNTLRALADLEDQRRSGAITEAEYQLRRREILEADPATR
jgi:hypothetical protein